MTREYLNHYQQVSKLFTEHFKDRKEVSGIEIGTKCGDLTRTILWALPQCQLYTIDPWLHIDGAEFEAGEPQEYHNGNKAAAIQRLVSPEFKDRVVQLEMTSEQAHKWITEKNPGKLFDFVWIDGDHSEKGILKDLELYEPLVAPGGIFGGHDYGQVHPLTEIILKTFDKALNSGNDFTWWIYK